MLLPLKFYARARATPIVRHASALTVKRPAESDADPQNVALDFAKPKSHKQSVNMNLVFRSRPEDGWHLIRPKAHLKPYVQLSKAKLSALITISAIGGFVMAPTPILLSSLASCTVGTFLLSATANTFNHLLETPYDAQMKRTQSRPLVIRQFMPLHAISFAFASATAGFAILWFGCNPLTASLGLLNTVLYAGVYTPMKRYSILCTWVGAVVGAIPPMMGYVGATGFIDSASLVLAAVLFSWQFPHFNSLSWNIRADYTRAGYRVMCAVNEGTCRRTALRHSLLLSLLCSLAVPASGLTGWSFAIESLPLNGILLYLSYKFYSQPDARSSRALFLFTLLHLPLIMMLMTISKFEHRKKIAVEAEKVT